MLRYSKPIVALRGFLLSAVTSVIGGLRDSSIAAGRLSPRNQRLFAYTCLAIAMAAVVFASFLTKTIQVDIDPQNVRHREGAAYIYDIPPPPLFFRLWSDSERSGESRLILVEDSTPLPLPHKMHHRIVEVGGGRYSHWGNLNKVGLGQYVVFSALDSSDVRVNNHVYRVVMPLALSPKVKLFVFVCAIAISIWAYIAFQLVLSKDWARFLRAWSPIAVPTAHVVAFLLPLSAIILFIAATIASKSVLGPIPATGGGGMAWASYIARWGNIFPSAVVLVGLMTYIGTWLLHLSGRPVHLEVNSLLRVCAFSFLILISSIFFLTSVKIVQDTGALGVTGYLTFIGGAPHSDPAGYFECILRLSETGHWTNFCSRRPAAASLRAVTFLIGGGTVHGAILIQNIFLSAMLSVVSTILFRKLGLAAAIVFFGLVLLHAAPFSATLLTEPLGIFMAVLSVGILAVVWERKTLLMTAFVVPFISTLALFVRMGAMFTAFAIGAWSVFCFRKKGLNRIAVAVVLVAVSIFSVVASNLVLNKLYGQGSIGGNFSYTLYGISVGKAWNAALTEVPLTTDPEENNRRIFDAAFQNIKNDPRSFVVELIKREVEFLDSFPRYFVSGYSQYSSFEAWGSFFLICLIIGIFYTLRFRFVAGNAFFIIVYVLGVLASAPLIVRDDGTRVMVVSTIYLAFFASYFMQSPIHKQKRSDMLSRPIGIET